MPILYEKKEKTFLNVTLDRRLRDARQKRRCKEKGVFDGEQRTAPLIPQENIHTLIVKTCY